MTTTAAAKAAATTSSTKRPLPVTSTSGSAGSNGTLAAQKKRPYRRTKRPKNYCDKSTVTTTTPTAQLPVNVFDAVLGECEDLLRASLEAQRLGRLKMASAYQLLLHTRLVGLGKRFDRSHIAGAPKGATRRKSSDAEDYDPNDDDEEHDSPVISVHNHQNASPSAMAAAASAAEAVAGATADGVSPSALPSAALEQLTQVLPSNLEMDASMMEHLARAAVELHHQRTGRKKAVDGLLASPMTGLIGSPPQPPQSLPSSTNPLPPKSSAAAAVPDTTNSSVAWTQAEQDIVNAAIKTKDYTAFGIAEKLPSKTEAQVKAYLKNQQKLSSVKQSTVAQSAASLAAGGEDVTTIPGTGTKSTPDGEDGKEAKKRGGRGRKPPTTAMNTVPNANLDAKSLLQRALEGRT